MAVLDYSGYLNHPGQINLAGDEFALAIEKFNGRVKQAAMQAQHIKPYFTFTPLTGTTTMSNASMGEASIGKVTAGVEPSAGTIEMGRQIVTVETPIICRVIVSMLEDVQDRLSVRSRLPENFGRAIQKHEDKVLLVKLVQAARTASGPVSDIPGGTVKTYATAGDEDDPDKAEALILSLAQAMDVKEVPRDNGMFAVDPETYYTLLQADKLIDVNFSSGNGNYADVRILRAGGFPLMKTNRFTQSADNGSVAGSIGNLYGSAYYTDATGAKVKGAFLTNEALMVAEAISLTTKVWWSDQVLCWFIDGFEAFGAATDRADYAAAIFKL